MTTKRTATVSESDLRLMAKDLNRLISLCSLGRLSEAGKMAEALAETIAEMIPRTTAADLPAAERAHLPGAFCLVEDRSGLWVPVAVIDDARVMLCSSTSPSPDLVTVDLDEVTVLAGARAWDYHGQPIPPARWEEIIPDDEDAEATGQGLEDDEDASVAVSRVAPDVVATQGAKTESDSSVLAECVPIGWSEFVALPSESVVRGYDGQSPVVATKLRRGRWQVEGISEVLRDEDAWDVLGGDGQVEELRA